ncbi:propionate catabolism operon regulatory protein PrpR [Chiayiivirga flava]|uniref:Propionate catabolism operon transcriptional regulator n=1 Tax=Chiayiivirga flava TaxID=659595 RepID=A0A7W8D3C7_9GAMM|nr:propionate catabolism operon regulatory protein PrpR [Chiayiivirga flava]MBB5207193.1 propionate catabolism operon transcriptional regulator [Chiayiivirga flava]
MDHRPVIWTVSISRLTRLLSDVMPEFDARADISPINAGFDDAVAIIRKRLRTERCDVLVAGGSNAAYLRSRLDVPLVPVEATGFDLMEALARARGIATRIGVVTHATDVPDFDAFRQRFKLAIEHRRFVTQEDARNRVAELAAAGTGVIVGTGMAIDFADAAGVPGVLLYSADSVRNAFERAIALTQTVAQTVARAGGEREARPRARGESRVLVGDSAPMQAVRERIAIYARHGASVLVQGETGTGKELVARALHSGSGRRGRFVALNCGALSESLLEAELFGHADGAFTGARRGGRAGYVEAADGGTLFLDEIGELPLPLQTRLLRVLEEREVQRVGSTLPVPVDVRVVAASLRDLDAEVTTGGFRADLFYRIAVLRIVLPTLAARRDDIDGLVDLFFRPYGDARRIWREGARRLLRAAAWPGNVRELRNVVERVGVHWQANGAGAAIDAAALRAWVPELGRTTRLVGAGVSAHGAHAPDGGQATSGGRVRRPSAAALRVALAAVDGNREAAAEALGVSRTTLWRWLHAAGITA